MNDLKRRRSQLNDQYDVEQIKQIDEQIQLLIDSTSQKHASDRKKDAIAAQYDQMRVFAERSGFVSWITW